MKVSNIHSASCSTGVYSTLSFSNGCDVITDGLASYVSKGQTTLTAANTGPFILIISRMFYFLSAPDFLSRTRCMVLADGGTHVIGALVSLLPLDQDDLGQHQGGHQDQNHLRVHGLVPPVLHVEPLVLHPAIRNRSLGGRGRGLCGSCCGRVPPVLSVGHFQRIFLKQTHKVTPVAGTRTVARDPDPAQRPDRALQTD